MDHGKVAATPATRARFEERYCNVVSLVVEEDRIGTAVVDVRGGSVIVDSASHWGFHLVSFSLLPTPVTQTWRARVV